MNKVTEKFLYENWFKLVITFIAFVALGIYAFQTFVTIPQEKNSKELAVENKRKENKMILATCINASEEAYLSTWELDCKRLKRGTNCTLPKELALGYDARLKDGKDRCIKIYDMNMKE